MHTFLESVIEIFRSSGHTTAQRVASNLANIPEYGFSKKFPPVPSLQYLDAALSQPGAHPIVHEIVTLVNHLPWEVIDPEVALPRKVAEHAFCQIAGPDGLLVDDTIRMGVFLQSPEVFYPPHSHNAEEVYFVLSGTALWQQDSGSLVQHSPGTFIHHVPNQPHAMHTQKEALLAIWGWSGDIGFESYRFH
ncbi:MAG: dimethylsulfonioproprionate lyase family protein [Alphaproteobacteria bacterium]